MVINRGTSLPVSICQSELMAAPGGAGIVRRGSPPVNSEQRLLGIVVQSRSLRTRERCRSPQLRELLLGCL
jgi:hypothetical protein